MKQCDRNLSPFPIASSSLSFPPSESDSEDSFWREFSFDFSFLTSEDHKNSLDGNDDDDATPSKAEESKGDFVRPVRVQRFDLEIKRIENSDLNCGDDSKPSPSLDVVPTSHFDSSFDVVEGGSQHYPLSLSVLGVTKIAAVANNDVSGNGEAKGRFLEELVVNKDINGSNSTPLFSKMSPLPSNSTVFSEKSSMFSDQEDTEVDSPCWRGIRSHNTAASGTKSFDLRRSSDDLNVLSRLNPLAPQFVPSSAKKNIDKNGKVSEEYSSSSLKRSLSLTFPASSGEVSITDPSGAWIEYGSGQNNLIDILVQDVDESLGLVSQESICKTLSILDISDELQKSKKLDPLAPLFVPANAKLSAVIHEKHGVAAHSTSVVSSSGDVAKVETHPSEVDHSVRNPYSINVHESGRTYSFNPRPGVQITENTPKLDGSSKTSHGPKKLNPLAPQFSLADTKPKGYGSEKKKAANDLPPKVKSSVLVPTIGYKNHNELHAGLVNSPAYVEPSSSNVNALSDFGHRVGHCGSTSSPKMDVTKLLTTIHGLSELLAHVGGSETSDSPNEQHLDLINSTVQNLNSYVNNRVQEHTGTYASPIHSSYDPTLMPNTRKRSFRDRELPIAQNMTYSMVSGEMVLHDSQFEYGVSKENGYVKVTGNHLTEEQVNPQALFYRSLWLKAKADSSLMEYETFLAKNKNFSNL